MYYFLQNKFFLCQNKFLDPVQNKFLDPGQNKFLEKRNIIIVYPISPNTFWKSITSFSTLFKWSLWVGSQNCALVLKMKYWSNVILSVATKNKIRPNIAIHMLLNTMDLNNVLNIWIKVELKSNDIFIYINLIK
jgi:hypothetical protein